MNNWKESGEKLVLTVKCNDFKHAVDRLNAVAEIAEKLQHHPDITVQNYNEIVISTSTHDAGKVTQKDYELAAAIDKAFTN